ncbi:MAG: class I SAM-dependent methyltransferase, partial [Gammaproteobacteria bacterium]
AIARRNATRLGFDDIDFRTGDWCKALDREFHVIVSNPPYVRDDDPHLARGDVRFEPRHALAAGPDGLRAIREIAACAPAHLEANGWLLLEHGHDQADAVATLLGSAGMTNIRHWQDIAGHTRVTGGRR